MTTRQIALETLISVTEDAAYANLALKAAKGKVAAGEVKFLYALVYTALEKRSYLEYVLSHYVKRQKRVVRNALLLGATELLYLNTPSHAAVSEWVRLVRLLGKNASCGVVNAVLRRIDRERDALPPLPKDPQLRLSIETGYPLFLVQEWSRRYGSMLASALCRTKASPMQVRAQYPCTTEMLLSRLPSDTVRGRLDDNCLYLADGLDVENDSLYQTGQLTIQNEGAMLLCRALGDVRSKRVLDACAAPGGKTAYLASLSEHRADLVSWELHPHRKSLLDATLKRLHVSAQTEERDATVFDPALVDSFDAILLDVPCSGFGLLSDKPDLRFRKTEKDVLSLLELQARILNTCSAYLKRGGTLVYATCTISERENEAQAERFLSSHPDFALLEQRQYLPPTDGVDGFFYAKMKRT